MCFPMSYLLLTGTAAGVSALVILRPCYGRGMSRCPLVLYLVCNLCNMSPLVGGVWEPPGQAGSPGHRSSAHGGARRAGAPTALRPPAASAPGGTLHHRGCQGEQWWVFAFAYVGLLPWHWSQLPTPAAAQVIGVAAKVPSPTPCYNMVGGCWGIEGLFPSVGVPMPLGASPLSARRRRWLQIHGMSCAQGAW